jgi:hypothetical protein
MYFKKAYEKYLQYTPERKFNASLERIQSISTGLQNGENYTIMRFNDGEWAFAFEFQPYINQRLETLHTSPEAPLCLKYAGRLLRKVINGSPEYMVSIDSFSRTKKPFVKFVNNNIHKFKNVIGGGIFNIWSLYTGFEDLFDILSKRNTLVVGPEFLEKLPFDAEYIKINNVTAVYDIQKNVWELIRYLDKHYTPNMVIVYSCSFVAKIAIDEIYKIYGDTITQLDVGAALNPFVGVTDRPWHKLMLNKLNSKQNDIK